MEVAGWRRSPWWGSLHLKNVREWATSLVFVCPLGLHAESNGISSISWFKQWVGRNHLHKEKSLASQGKGWLARGSVMPQDPVLCLCTGCSWHYSSILQLAECVPGGSVIKNLPANARDRVRSLVGKIPWRREWQPIPIFLPGEFHGQRILVGCRPWGLQRNGHDWATITSLHCISLV